MNNRKTLLAVASFLIAIAVISCNHDKKKDCIGGSGGNLTIAAFPQHHTKPILNKANYLDTVFIKYNTLDKPADDKYDTYFVGEEGEDHVHLKGLKCGNYYFFATGFDTTIAQRVSGGIPYTTDKNDGEIDLDIPVTE